MDVKEHLIFLRNKDQTSNIEACTYNHEKWNIKFYGNSKVYTYNSNNVSYDTNPVKIDARMSTVYQDDQPITGVTKIVQFKTYTRLIFRTGYSAVYRNSSIHIEQTSLNKNDTQQVFKYLSILANNVNETVDEQPSFLGKLYQNLKHISPRSILSHYLSGKPPISRTNKRELIFPFGFNMSQKAATEKAFTEQVSIIEGPPGTGKTQTILNIIANAIIRNETVAVVSNNNSATANVLEKLQQYDLDFFAAYLGNKENQESFFENQTGLYPKMTHWHLEEQKYQSIKTELEHSLLELDKMLELKNSQAKLKQQLTDFQTEYRYFEDYMKNFSKNQFQFKSITRLTSDRLLRLLIRFMGIFKSGKIKLRNKLYNLFVYRIFNFGIYKLNPEKIITLLQDTYYNTKMTELEDEINDIETKLYNYHFEENMKAQSKNSMK